MIYNFSLLDQTVPPSLLYHACEVFIPELEKAISKPVMLHFFLTNKICIYFYL